MENENKSLYEKLKKLHDSDEYPFHMPGHKRSPKAGIPGEMAQLDITEIEGFDNLHHAEGILKEAMENAAKLYGSEETHFLVNGSTCGILTAISAVVREGDTLILGRNAHASAYHGVYLRGAKVKSLFPELLKEEGLYGIVQPQEVRRVLEETPEAKAVMMTSPTYDGFVSDIREIARIVHEYGKILIVDEAHGAHFGLDERLPESSIACGADLVIHSLHKTLPALTQTALLHINGERVDRERVRRFLKIYQSSSPSYLLMGSADHCIRQMQSHAKEWFDRFFVYRGVFMKQMQVLRHLCVADENFCAGNGMKAFDSGKLLILTQQSGYTGKELQELLLQKYHLQVEMAGTYYIVAIITVMDEQEGFERLAHALFELDIACPAAKKATENPLGNTVAENPVRADMELLAQVISECRDHSPVCTLKEALEADDADIEAVPFADSLGRIVAEQIYLYPPGIPVILPGERMTRSVMELIQNYRRKHLPVQGMSDRTCNTIRCLK